MATMVVNNEGDQVGGACPHPVWCCSKESAVDSTNKGMSMPSHGPVMPIRLPCHLFFPFHKNTQVEVKSEEAPLANAGAGGAMELRFKSNKFGFLVKYWKGKGRATKTLPPSIGTQPFGQTVKLTA